MKIVIVCEFNHAVATQWNHLRVYAETHPYWYTCSHFVFRAPSQRLRLDAIFGTEYEIRVLRYAHREVTGKPMCVCVGVWGPADEFV